MTYRRMVSAIFLTVAFAIAPTPALAAKCGGLNQKACRALKKGPVCQKWLRKVKKICRPCGDLNQRACPLLAKGKPCKPGLRKKARRCVKDDPKRAILAKARTSAKTLKPLLRSLGSVAKKIGNPRTIKEIKQAFKDKRPNKIHAIIKSAQTRAVTDGLKKEGFRSLTLGISSAASLAVGYSREAGAVTNIDATPPARLYVSKTWSGGIQFGVGNDLVLSAYTANPDSINGKSWAAIGNFDVGSGLGIVLYYDQQSLLLTGISVGVGIGSAGAGGAVGEATTTICPAKACNKL